MTNRELHQEGGIDVIMSHRSFVRSLAALTFLTSAIVAASAMGSYGGAIKWSAFFGGAVATFLCASIVTFVDAPFLRCVFLGVMSLCFGFTIGPIATYFHRVLIIQATVTTAFIAISMSVVAFCITSLIRGRWPYVLAAVSFFVVAFGNWTRYAFAASGHQMAEPASRVGFWWNWLGIAFFTWLLARDWSRSVMNKSYTLNNAIDASAGYVIDIVKRFRRHISTIPRR